MTTFEIGKVYWATPILNGRPRRLVIAIGRDEGMVQLAFVETLTEARILSEHFFGKEFVKIQDDEAEYNCSSSCEVDAVHAAEVYASIHARCGHVH